MTIRIIKCQIRPPINVLGKERDKSLNLHVKGSVNEYAWIF